MSHRVGSSIKYSGLSKSVRVHELHRSRRRVTILSASKQSERKAMYAQQRQNEIQGYSQEDRDAVERMDVDAGYSNHDVSAASNVPPPGEEGFDISHEGGEFEVFEELTQGLAQSMGYKRTDDRTRQDRVDNSTAHWELQMTKLVDAFLEFCTRDHGDGLPTPPNPTRCDETPVIVNAIDMYFQHQSTFLPVIGDVYPNETLIHHGFIGCAPLYPVRAFSIRTLESFRQSHRTSPRFSIEAQCKTLCHMNKIPYKPYLRTQFSDAFDAYLNIHRRVDQMINTALNLNTPASRILRTCPCCFYQLNGEPVLEFSFFCSIDGNNSLKRIGTSTRAGKERLDTRELIADRWLRPQDVDRFKDDVKSNLGVKNSDNYPNSDDWEDVEDGTGSLKCLDRWRNAGPEDRKRMFALFDESGIFIASCRHRMVLVACDMVQSGELAKYPLAVVDRLMDIAGFGIGCAYDIGCAFDKTVQSSSLRERIQDNNFRLMVGAFHGHAHNRLCQLEWHPLHIKGTGNTEGEGCEHIFSSSNDLARVTRHATRFHRHQSIEEHFKFWDEDKYANLSKFLRNHYREALASIHMLEEELKVLRDTLSVSDDDFESYLKQERQYLKGLKEPSPTFTLKTQYIKGLRELSQCKREWEAARGAANKIFTSVATDQIHQAILQVHRRVDVAFEKLQQAETFVETMENSLGIEERWTESSQEYKEFYQQHVLTNYSHAIDELERLVVMRLFELVKMSTSGTGYKLRRQIGRALQRRSEAIRSAISRYNIQAAKLDPPRPALSWKEIVDYSFLGEFDLLRLSRGDIRGEPWAQPARREATVKYFKLCRAREELVRLNIEMRRLRTFIHDETSHIEGVISSLTETQPFLAAEIQRRWTLRSAINNSHIQYLNEIENTAGFTGLRGIGCHKRDIGMTQNIEEQPVVPSTLEDITDDSYVNEEAADDRDRALATITDFVLNITD